MEAADSINCRHGTHTIRTLAAGIDRGWELRRARLLGRYTTRLNEVLRVKARQPEAGCMLPAGGC